MPLTEQEFEAVVRAAEARVIQRLRAASLISQQRQDAVLEACTDVPASVRDLAELTGISKSAVHRRLAALIEADLVAKKAGGYVRKGYSPPPAPPREDPRFRPNGAARCERCRRPLQTFGTGTNARLLSCACVAQREAVAV